MADITNNPMTANESEQLAFELVDTVTSLNSMLDTLQIFKYPPPTTPSLYIDLEGENLSRHGSISLLQIFFLPKCFTYLIDVHTLGKHAFTTCASDGHDLKEILESEKVIKVIFDVRTDSDALYNHFDINLAGVQDLQLLELATRNFSRRCVNGLAKCIERDAGLTQNERSGWKTTKEKGATLFAPERGGSYQVFNDRPLSEAILKYCIQDVQFLPRLWSTYKTRLTPFWEARVLGATEERILLSKAPGFNGQGRHMALAPNGWV